MLDDKTAADTANMLASVVFGMPTGGLSLLDENTRKWAATHPELREVQEEFGKARGGWWPYDPRRNSPEAWAEVVRSALCLSDALSVYGDERLTLCGRPSLYGGACRAVKLADGACTYGPDSHTDSEETTQ